MRELCPKWLSFLALPGSFHQVPSLDWVLIAFLTALVDK